MTAQKLDVSPLSVRKWRQLVYQRLIEIDSPRSLSIFMIMNNTDNGGGTDDEIVSLKTDPLHFTDSDSFMSFYEPTELVRKSTLLTLSTDPREVAIASFFESETKCAESNRRLRTVSPTWAVGEILHLAEQKIRSVLPELDHETLDLVLDHGGWGPGVTSSSKGEWLSEYNKIIAEPQCSPALYPMAQALIRECPLWSELGHSLKVIPGSRIAFVPKDAKTDRTIAIEPSINSFFQKGQAYIIRKALLKWGLDLRDQTKNQRLAYLGSKFGQLATIDLSAASDTISIGIVERLLPSEWVTFLGLTRSEQYSINGTDFRRFHKWSSMGNGYTFDLETLVFASLVKATLHFLDINNQWSVYGDDIIIDVRAYDLLAEVFDYCGFSVNQRKSFKDGPFRESCGEDFFEGHRVRPFYIKDVEWHTSYVYANWILKNRHRIRYTGRCYNALIRSVPESRRFFIPMGCGLVGFEVDRMDASTYPVYRPKGLYAWYATGAVWVPRKLGHQNIDGPGAVLSHIRLLTARSSDVSYPLTVTARGSGRWIQKTVIVTQWPPLPLG